MKRANQQAGFTIIELVMVIVILGILSAFALPRFADFGADAREASLDGVAGAIKAAASIAHADFLVGGLPVELEGQTIAMANGYPAAVANGIQLAAGIDDNDFTITVVAAAGGNPGTITVEIQTDCDVVYAEALVNGAFDVTTDKTGCT